MIVIDLNHSYIQYFPRFRCY